MEQFWTFIHTICKGVLQGTKQFIDNDLQSFVPLFIFAAVVIVAHFVYGFIRNKIEKK